MSVRTLTPKEILNEALNDESGAGFHVRLWLVGGQVVESIAVFSQGDGFAPDDPALTGERTIANGEMPGKCSFLWQDISGLEIQW